MSIEDIYSLPMVKNEDCILDASYRYKIDFDVSDSNCLMQIDLVAKAINNHDNLVMALKDVIENNGDLASIMNAKSAIDKLTSDDLGE